MWIRHSHLRLAGVLLGSAFAITGSAGSLLAQDQEVKLLDGNGYVVFVSIPRAGGGNWCRQSVFLNVRAASPAPFLGQRTELQNAVRAVSSRCPAARTVRITGFLGDRRVYTGAVSDLHRDATLRDMSVDKNMEARQGDAEVSQGGRRTATARQEAPAHQAPPAAVSGSVLSGTWEGHATCGRERADFVLKAEAGAGGDDTVLLERYGPNALLAPVTYLQYVARPEGGGGKYRFAPATGQPFRIGQQSGPGFDGQVSQNRQELAITFDQCGTITLRRVTPQSTSRVASVPSPPGGGTYRAGDSLEGRCNALIAWAGRISREYPNLDMRQTVLGEIYPKAVLLYADDDFIPVFGQPYDFTHSSVLDGIWDDVRSNCRGNAFTKDRGGWIWGHTIFKGLNFRPNTHYSGSFSTAAIVQAIRATRGVRHEVKGAHGGAPAEFAPASRMFIDMRNRLTAHKALLWPSELSGAQDAITKKLNAVALKEGEATLARIKMLRDPVDGLKAVRDALDPKETGFFTHLRASDKTAIGDSLAEHRRRFTTEAMQPVTERAMSAAVTLEGARFLGGQNSALLSLLTAADQKIYRDQLDRRRDEILARLAENDLGTLRAMRPGLEGLKAGAAWIAEFDGKYRDFSSLPAIAAARAAFVSDRAARLVASAPELEAQLGMIDRSSTESASKVRSILDSFLCWSGDQRLPEMLELAFIAARFGAM